MSKVSDSTFVKYMTSSTTWAAAGGAAFLITSIVLLVIGVHHLHFIANNGNYVGGNGLYHTAQDSILLSNKGQICGLFGGAGGAAGVGVFIIKKLVTNKILEKLENKRKEKPWVEKTICSAGLVNTVLAVGAIVGSAALLGICLHYLFSTPNAYHWWGGNSVGSFVWKNSIEKVCIGLTASGFMATLGLLELIASRFVHKTIIQVKRVGIENSEL